MPQIRDEVIAGCGAGGGRLPRNRRRTRSGRLRMRFLGRNPGLRVSMKVLDGAADGHFLARPLPMSPRVSPRMSPLHRQTPSPTVESGSPRTPKGEPLFFPDTAVVDFDARQPQTATRLHRYLRPMPRYSITQQQLIPRSLTETMEGASPTLSGHRSFEVADEDSVAETPP